jgi:hypothetical protein
VLSRRSPPFPEQGGGDPLCEVEFGEREGERAPLAELALHPDLAAVPRHDLLAEIEADAEPSARAPGVVALLHELEDPLARLGSDAAPAIGHRDAHERRAAAGRGRDLDRSAVRRELDRVVDQIRQDLADPHLVGEHGRQRVDARGDRDALGLGGGAPDLDHVLDHRAELERARRNAQLAVLDARDLDQVADHAAHLLRVAQTDAEIFALLGGDRAREPVEHDREQLVQRRERRAQLVREVREELGAHESLIGSSVGEIERRARERRQAEPCAGRSPASGGSQSDRAFGRIECIGE